MAVESVNLDHLPGESNTDAELEEALRSHAKKKEQYSDWNNWDFSKPPPWFRPTLYGTLALLFVFIVIVLPILLGSCSDVVPFESNAVIVNYKGTVEDKAVGPGRVFRAAGFRVQRYPRFDTSVQYTSPLGNPIQVRVQDGQVISLDISWQYNMAKENLVAIYRQHKGSFATTLSQVIFSTLRDTAAGYTSEDFFTNRTEIERELRASIVAEAAARLATVTGFQVRAVDLPYELDNRLIQIQLRQQDARAGTERLELDRIQAESDRAVLELRTQRNKIVTQLQQETVVLLTDIRQDEERVKAETQQLVTRIEQTAERNISLYSKETELLVEDLDLKRTVILEETRRLVEDVNVNLATNMSIYRQETENLRLQFENEIAVILEETSRNVSRILADTDRQEQAFDASFLLQESAVRRQAALMREAAVLAAAAARNEALQRGLKGLPASAYIAKETAAALHKHVRFLDVKTPDNLSLDSNV